MSDLLIRRAEVDASEFADVRCADGKIVELGSGLNPRLGSSILSANGGVLLPGLHDHHLHLLSLAAARSSIRCGPPLVSTASEFDEVLKTAPGAGWIRGIDYHESVAGELTRSQLDAIVPDRPVRIQHRSGRVWFCNSEGLQALGQEPSGSGHLFRKDEEVRRGRTVDDELKRAVLEVCDELLARGITEFTDATPSNDETTRELFASLHLPQNYQLMGSENLAKGPLKLLIDDYQLPDFDVFCDRISEAHEQGRTVAVHCVTLVELVFTVSALSSVGSSEGDRIEHASQVNPALVKRLRELGVTVVTQPNFIFERGDQYLDVLSSEELDDLYRCGTLINSGIRVGAGSDAPFGEPNPWLAMSAAVNRATRNGHVLGDIERLTPERALGLYTSPLNDPGNPVRKFEVGDKADFCLLSSNWSSVSRDLAGARVAATVIDGRVCFNSTGMKL